MTSSNNLVCMAVLGVVLFAPSHERSAFASDNVRPPQDHASRSPRPTSTRTQREHAAPLATPCLPRSQASTIRFTLPADQRFRCGATNLDWRSFAGWQFPRNWLQCGKGERRFKVQFRIKGASPAIQVGTAIYAPEDDKWWEPILNDRSELCRRALVPFNCLFDTSALAIRLRNWKPAFWHAGLWSTAPREYHAYYCVPEYAMIRDKLPDKDSNVDLIERILRFQVRQNGRVLEDCCIHVKSALPLPCLQARSRTLGC